MLRRFFRWIAARFNQRFRKVPPPITQADGELLHQLETDRNGGCKMTYQERLRDGTIGLNESWFDRANRVHREGGPALIGYDSRGEIVHQAWYIHGILHRFHEPALLNRGKSPLFVLHGEIIHDEAEFLELCEIPELERLCRIYLKASEKEKILDMIRKINENVAKNMQATEELM